MNYRTYVTGTTRLKLNQSRMRSIPIPLAPFNEQVRIVAKVEELFSRIDQGILTLQETLQQLEQYRRSTLKKAFTGKHTEKWRCTHQEEMKKIEDILQQIKKYVLESGVKKRGSLDPIEYSELDVIPEKWIWTKIGSISDVIRGGSPRPKGNPKYFGGSIPWIMISDITKEKGKYISKTKDTVTEAGAKKSRYLTKETLILSNSGTVCVPKILAVDGCIHDGFLAFPKIHPDINLLYLYYYFEYIRPNIRIKHKQGVTQVNLNITIGRNIEVPFTHQMEQNMIVNILEQCYSIINLNKLTIQKNIENGKRLKQSILKKAFQGGLVHHDPNDEPASVFLARVKAEKAKKYPARRRGRRARKVTSGKKDLNERVNGVDSDE